MATVIRGDDNFDTAYLKAIAILADVKSTGVDGGTSVVGWQDRDLNTELSDSQNLVTLSSNQFTIQAGKYLIEWSSPAYKSSEHNTNLYNVTTSSVEAEGESGFAWSGDNTMTRSAGTAIVAISVATAFKIRHYLTSAHTTGLGVWTTSGQGNSVFTRVIIHKIGA